MTNRPAAHRPGTRHRPRGLILALSLAAGAGALALAAPLLTPAALAGDDQPRDTIPGATSAPMTPRSVTTVAGDLDAAIRAAWKREGLKPTTRCSDEEFVRRIYLDLVGTPPNAQQVTTFLSDKRPDARARLVDALLETPGYARNFAEKWGSVLVGEGNGSNDREFTPGMFRAWLEKQLLADRPYPEIVSELLTAGGTVYTNPAVNFSGRRGHNPSDVAGAAAKAFLGVQIQCAQCHDHPYEEITQQDFLGMAAFFTRVRFQPTSIPYEEFGARGIKYKETQIERRMQEFLLKGKTEAEARKMAEQRLPKSIDITDLDPRQRLPRNYAKRMEQRLGEAATAEPRFLLSREYAESDAVPRRTALAQWITSSENPYTARALANRTWGWLLGRGFVHPVDDFSSVNIAAVPDALALLSADTAASGFDTKRLLRIITATEAYQLSTATTARTAHAEEFFAAGPLKPLRPQQIFDSLQVALGLVADGTAMTGLDGTAFSALEMDGGRGMMAMGYDTRDGLTRQLQRAARDFFSTFEDDEAEETGGTAGTIPQGLMWLNSGLLNDLITNPRYSIVPDLVDRHDDEKARIKELFLRTLSRRPTSDEMQSFVRFVKSQPRHGATSDEADDDKPGKGRKKNRGRKMTKEDTAHAAYADVLWTLISTSEFATNH